MIRKPDFAIVYAIAVWSGVLGLLIDLLKRSFSYAGVFLLAGLLLGAVALGVLEWRRRSQVIAVLKKRLGITGVELENDDPIAPS